MHSPIISAFLLLQRSSADVQTLLANGLVDPNAISGLLAALASSPGTPCQSPLAPAPVANAGLPAGLAFQGAPQQVGHSPPIRGFLMADAHNVALYDGHFNCKSALFLGDQSPAHVS